MIEIGICEAEEDIGVAAVAQGAEASEVLSSERQEFIGEGESVRAGDGVVGEQLAEIPLIPIDGIDVVPDVGPGAGIDLWPRVRAQPRGGASRSAKVIPADAEWVPPAGRAADADGIRGSPPPLDPAELDALRFGTTENRSFFRGFHGVGLRGIHIRRGWIRCFH